MRKKEIKDTTIREITKHEKQETTFCSTLALVSLQYFFRNVKEINARNPILFMNGNSSTHQLFIQKSYNKLGGGALCLEKE